ncbi:uncharacterized protein APUU_70346A [Aspergillus puulaauensis]|uniref:Uncharacterized protein n=1 Tax=Aspergillus puulaauensis TaxID=1220207 RepID=A0A7R7XWB3_9EURO|nr:uncharacterized protein APUU_70346A [Aspergillus puulaauensis]BCS28776.1 hypothetical protein APUU_70346A [Aspergillus puulaauensis]
MKLIKDLMVRLSRDANRLNRDHRPLVAFAKESCVELPAGGKKLFMRPQCVRHTQTGGSSGSVPRAIFVFPISHGRRNPSPEPKPKAGPRRPRRDGSSSEESRVFFVWNGFEHQPDTGRQ